MPPTSAVVPKDWFGFEPCCGGQLEAPPKRGSRVPDPVFGTAVDVTAAELAIESFLPADEDTARALRQMSAAAGDFG